MADFSLSSVCPNYSALTKQEQSERTVPVRGINLKVTSKSLKEELGVAEMIEEIKDEREYFEFPNEANMEKLI